MRTSRNRFARRSLAPCLLLGLTAGFAACGGGKDPELLAPVETEGAVASNTTTTQARDVSTTTEASPTTEPAAPEIVTDGLTATDLPAAAEEATTVPAMPSPGTRQVDAAAASSSVGFLNQRRAENQLAPLTVDPELAVLAERWADQLATDKRLRHNPDAWEQRPTRYSSIGENVGFARSAGSIDNGWWASEGHKANMLDTRFNSVGTAFVIDENGTCWGVQVFAGH